MKRRARRVPLLVGVIAATVAACTGGGGSATDPTAAPTAATATTAPDPGLTARGCAGCNRSPSETSAAPTTTTLAPLAARLDIERADLAGLAERGDDAVLVDAAVADDGRTTAVGRVARSGRVRPFLVESSDGQQWRSVDLPLERGADGELVAVASAPGGDIVAGIVRWPDGTWSPSTWVRIGRRWTGPYPAAQPGDTEPVITEVAAGTVGAVLLGRIGGDAQVWLSSDGRLWNEAPPEWDAARGATFVAIGGRIVVVRLDIEGGSLDWTMLVGDIGGALETAPFTGPDRAMVSGVVPTDDGFIAVGGARRDAAGEYSPAVWQSPDGLSWRRARGAIPVTDEPSSNVGTMLDVVAVGPGGDVFAADGGVLWRSTDGGSTFAPAPAAPGNVSTVVASAPPLVVADGRVLVLEGEAWAERAGEVIPRADVTATLDGVTHAGGTWYAVGREVRTGPEGVSTLAVVWRSADGRRWDRLADGDPVLAGIALTAVTGADGGLIAIGNGADGEQIGVARVLRSVDGTAWTAVESSELAASEGFVQLEAVAPGPQRDAYTTGYVFDGVDIRPLVLQIAGDTVTPMTEGLDVAPGDVITSGVCSAGPGTLVVGSFQGAPLTAQGWSSIDDGLSWQPIALGALSAADSCTADGRRLAIVGTGTGDGELDPAALVGRIGRLDRLDAVTVGGSGRAEAVALRGDTLAMAGSDDDDGVLWIGDVHGVVDQVSIGELDGPGTQQLHDVEIAGRTLVAVGSVLGEPAIWVGRLP